jgi:hypothetical protein
MIDQVDGSSVQNSLIDVLLAKNSVFVEEERCTVVLTVTLHMNRYIN